MACIEELHHKDAIGLHSTNPLRTQRHIEKRERERLSKRKTETWEISLPNRHSGESFFFFFFLFLHRFGRQDVLNTKFRTKMRL